MIMNRGIRRHLLSPYPYIYFNHTSGVADKLTGKLFCRRCIRLIHFIVARNDTAWPRVLERGIRLTHFIVTRNDTAWFIALERGIKLTHFIVARNGFLEE